MCFPLGGFVLYCFDCVWSVVLLVGFTVVVMLLCCALGVV